MRVKLFLLAFFLCHLDAFAFGGIPISWIGFLLCVLVCIDVRLMPFTYLSASFFSLIIILVGATIFFGQENVPLSYVLLRILNIIGFFVVVNRIALQASSLMAAKYLERSFIRIGLSISIIAIVVFFLHVFELGDLPRNRIGTSGSEQAIAFTFETGGLVNRAIGTFREPSFLAMALILPGALALKSRFWISFIFITLGAYLTYSLGAFISLLLAILVLGVLSLSLKSLLTALNYVILTMALVFCLKDTYIDSFYLQRISHMLDIDISNSSRGYIYNNMDIISDTWICGGGIGVFAYRLKDLFGLDYPVSVMNLYLSVISSGGIIALLILLYVIFYPNLAILKSGNNNKKALLHLVVPLNAFLFLYLTTFEELLIWHAVGFGLFLGYIIQVRRSISYTLSLSQR